MHPEPLGATPRGGFQRREFEMTKTGSVALVIGFLGLLTLSGLVFGTRNTSGFLKLIAILIIFGGIAVSATSRLRKSPQKTRTPQSIPAITESTLDAEKKHITAPVAFHYVVGRTEDGNITSGYMVGMVALDKKGYVYRHDLGHFPTLADAEAKAAEMNAIHGLSQKEAYRIVRKCI
jgi:hypothetical protein